jgi:hypothetical protein
MENGAMSSSYPGDDPRPGEQPTSGSDESGTTPPQQPPGHDEPGYWERMAAEQAREQERQGHPSTEETGPITPSGPVFNPTSAQPTTSYEQGSWGDPAAPPPSAPQQPGYPPPYAGQGQRPPYGQPYPPYQQPYQQGGQHPGQQPGQNPGQQPGQPPYQQPYQQAGAPYGQPYGQPYQQGPGQGYPPAYSYAPVRPMQQQATLAMALGIAGLVVGVFLTCGIGLLMSPFAWAIGRKSLREIEDSRGELDGESQARIGMVTGIVGTVLLGLAVLALVGFAVLLVFGATTSP